MATSVPTVRQAEPQRSFLLRLFGFDITRTKAAPSGLQSPASRGGWWPLIREPFTGAWQRNREQTRETILTFHAVYSVVTLIASDIAKCRVRLVEEDADGIWNAVDAASFSPVLRKPNRYQNRIKFYEHWVVSKLLHGNTYALKQRDNRNVVVAMYILDPTRTRPLVAPDGSVFYELTRDNLAGVENDKIVVPASEIIHDVMVPLFHPLCGVSPLTACGLAAVQGLNIQDHASSFFANGARPSGILTAPGQISDTTAKELKEYWDKNFTGDNRGKVAVLGDGLEYEQMTVNAVDAQLIEQLKWSAEVVCSAFHVPAYKVGVGTPPSYNNIEALDQQYYSQCLQSLFECIELCLDEGLGLTEVTGKSYGTEFDLDDLLRMDSKTMAETEDKLKNIKKPNESRKRLNLPPVPGGNSVYRQQQDFSLEALAKRDAQANPFASSGTSSKPPAAPEASDDEAPEDLAAAAQLAAWSLKSHLSLSARP
jgi:HK97 family phage portal protein